jgi:hypothetical protein
MRWALCFAAIFVAGCGGGTKTVTVERPAQSDKSAATPTGVTKSTPTAAMAHKNAFEMLAQQYGPGAGYKLTIEPCQQMSLYRFFCVFKAIKTGVNSGPIQNVVNGVCVEFSPSNLAVTNEDIRPQEQCT